MLAVTAIDRDNRLYPAANRGDYVALAAPGVGVRTVGADGALAARDGTSFATPFVTASLAVLSVQNPSSSPAQLRARLLASSVDLGAPGPDPLFGHGRLRAPSCR